MSALRHARPLSIHVRPDTYRGLPCFFAVASGYQHALGVTREGAIRAAVSNARAAMRARRERGEVVMGAEISP